ncbi:hypothetical protein psal_cds_712 [Pandoravirus salinus]|uniref:Uncharacterized protein n=1 Tax=Pandoravirus salinus TaxID=1349410 RepID=S4VVL0_9VIRU|nr:hypothetical protein psal_cds_712 [Pandoravirus salinus]AGO84674.1 hypothetical protein psal_cds_712 [Pandoravirus salinus]
MSTSRAATDAHADTFATSVPATDNDLFGCAERTCPVCACRAPAPSGWQQVCGLLRRAAASAAVGTCRAVGLVVSAVPHAVAFYGAAMGIKTGVNVLTLRNSTIGCAIRLDTLCAGYVPGLVCLCAVAYATNSVASGRAPQSDRARNGALALGSRIARATIAVGATACCIVSLAPRLARTTALRVGSKCPSFVAGYQHGMTAGVVVCAAAAVAVASSLILGTVTQKDLRQARRVLARIVDVEPEPPVPFMWHHQDAPESVRLADLLLTDQN